MPSTSDTIYSDLSHKDKVRLFVDMLHRAMMHHALWFTEVTHQMGMEKALERLHEVTDTSLSIMMKRLGNVLDFSMKEGLPDKMLALSPDRLDSLIEAVCINWLATDGVWFQSIENVDGMNDAKRCNDSCWGQFSPVEAASIKRFLGLSENPGLLGLKKALQLRLYAQINVQSFKEESSDCLHFYMNNCRVQAARKRKNLPDYPCKSAGLVEYAYFARAIDSRIETECIGCPPDAHPEDWFCAWRFRLTDR